MDAENAFQTEHGLVVKTADGAEYKIKVTDDQEAVSYLYPVYNGSDPKSGIKEWKTGSCNSYISVSTSDTTWGDDGNNWYVVEGTVDFTNSGTEANGITVSGDVHLILKDDCELTVTGAGGKAGICVSGTGNSLTIYGQPGGTGTLTATGGSSLKKAGAGIGGGDYEAGNNITINGGNVRKEVVSLW